MCSSCLSLIREALYLPSQTLQDVGAYLDASEERQFDLVVAAETLQYLGPLESVFADTFKVLKLGGHLAFTVDRQEEEEEEDEQEILRTRQVGWAR